MPTVVSRNTSTVQRDAHERDVDTLTAALQLTIAFTHRQLRAGIMPPAVRRIVNELEAAEREAGITHVGGPRPAPRSMDRAKARVRRHVELLRDLRDAGVFEHEVRRDPFRPWTWLGHATGRTPVGRRFEVIVASEPDSGAALERLAARARRRGAGVAA